MARLHARRKGKSHSNRPPLGRSINWLNISPEEVSSLAVKLKNDGVPRFNESTYKGSKAKQTLAGSQNRSKKQTFTGTG